ncbi:MAG: methyltransferase domain-containing protein, partial [Candidatus Falkowbacteria bacterium]
MKNEQEKFWSSKFGEDYTKRNIYDPKSLDKLYKNQFGVTKSEMNKEFLGNLKINNVLEVGCNIGNQLNFLQKNKYKNLYGIEILDYAVEEAKNLTKNINIIQGSAFDIPFKDNYFDLV